MYVITFLARNSGPKTTSGNCLNEKSQFPYSRYSKEVIFLYYQNVFSSVKKNHLKHVLKLKTHFMNVCSKQIQIFTPLWWSTVFTNTTVLSFSLEFRSMWTSCYTYYVFSCVAKCRVNTLLTHFFRRFVENIPKWVNLNLIRITRWPTNSKIYW